MLGVLLIETWSEVFAKPYSLSQKIEIYKVVKTKVKVPSLKPAVTGFRQADSIESGQFLVLGTDLVKAPYTTLMGLSVTCGKTRMLTEGIIQLLNWQLRW